MNIHFRMRFDYSNNQRIDINVLFPKIINTEFQLQNSNNKINF